jgi:hypothetical protein
VFVPLFIQHAWCMRRIILPLVACLTLSYFSTLSLKRHDFRKIFIEFKVCVLIYSKTSVWNISRSKNNPDVVSVHRSSCKVLVYSCQTLIKLEFSRQIFEKCSHLKFYKNPSSGNRVIPRGRTDRQTRRSWQSLFAVSRRRLKSTVKEQFSWKENSTYKSLYSLFPPKFLLPNWGNKHFTQHPPRKDSVFRKAQWCRKLTVCNNYKGYPTPLDCSNSVKFSTTETPFPETPTHCLTHR